MSEIRTRFAPSPTGKLHIGGLRTALYNWLYAKNHGGKFLLRIEDTDRTRLVEGAVQNIIDNLRWAGLSYDNEPVIQSQRQDLYRQAAEELVNKKLAYRCFCTPQRLEQLRQIQQAKKLPTHYDGHCRNLSAPEVAAGLADQRPSVIRFALPQHGTVTFTDQVRGEVRFNLATLDDQILMKSDGFPTYHLASVVDDHDMKISHVIRGEEWLPSTPKHILLYQAFGWTAPHFAHLPLLLNPDRSKLSKRTGDVAVDEYRTAGYLPEAVVNFILLMGWNPGTDQELFRLPEMVQQFSLEHINKSGAVFNRDKLDWFNGQYLRQKSVDELVTLARPYLLSAGIKNVDDTAYLQQVIALEQKRIGKLSDLPGLIEYFFSPPKIDVSALPWRKQKPSEAAQILREISQFLGNFTQKDFTIQDLETNMKAFVRDHGGANGPVLWPMRYALSGRPASPGPLEIAAVLGRQETCRRLERAASLVIDQS
ncbi:MAG: glutamate--tRNA ligase [Patescibacteria group bacterium]|nr:glutamate--tRNA ligase [Patescibacteria group bacterium]